MQITGRYTSDRIVVEVITETQQEYNIACKIQQQMLDRKFSASGTVGRQSFEKQFSNPVKLKFWIEECDRLCSKFGGTMTPEVEAPKEVNMDKVIEKIKKLLALSQSPNEAEAAAASIKAQQLLTQYNLNAADLQEQSEEVGTFEVEVSSKAVSWKQFLVCGIAKANFCKAFTYVTASKTMRRVALTLVGRPANTKVAKLQYEYLSQTVERLAQLETGDRAYKNAFRLGCANRISQRLKDSVEQQKEYGFTYENVTTSALAIRSLYERTEEEIDDYMDGKKIKKPSAAKYSSARGYSAGVQAGNSVSLDKQIAGV